MSMTAVMKLVKRWIDERVEVDSGVAIRTGIMFKNEVVFDTKVEMKTSNGFADFIEWLNEQKGWHDPVYAPQWGSTMKQIGFKQERDGNNWVIRGIQLKEN